MLAVSAVTSSDAEALATVATELLSAALDTPVAIVRGEDNQLVDRKSVV